MDQSQTQPVYSPEELTRASIDLLIAVEASAALQDQLTDRVVKLERYLAKWFGPDRLSPTAAESEWIDPKGMTCRIRVNVTKNTKGYQFDRTVEVEGVIAPDYMATRAAELLERTEWLAREDIARCEANDAGVSS